MMSSIALSRMARRPRAPLLLRRAPRCATLSSAPLVNLSFTPSISNSFWYCFTSAFFGCVRMCDQRVLVELVERRDHRQAADELGDHAELQQVLRLDLLEQLPLRCARPS